MKAILICCLLCVVVSCEEKEEVSQPYFYDGEYPTTTTGNPIKTYEPKEMGGEMEVFFKGHSWNHAPYLSLEANEMASSVTNNGQPQLRVGISLLVKLPPDACNFETLHIQIPLSKGRFTFTKDLQPNNEISARFYSMNCDAGKDKYVVDHSAGNSSWIDVKRYDVTSRALEAEFDLSFVVEERNDSFAPIYPTHINMRGRLKTVAKVFK